MSGTFQTVNRMDLDVKVSKDGELAAVNDIDVMSQVEGSVTMQLAKEGRPREEGDLLVKLDSSTIEQRIEDTTMAVQQAEADLATANELKLIQESQNAANMEAVRSGRCSWRGSICSRNNGGDVPRRAWSGRRPTWTWRRVMLKNAQEDYDQIQKLYEKGFVTTTETGPVKKSEPGLCGRRRRPRGARTALDVLNQHSSRDEPGDEEEHAGAGRGEHHAPRAAGEHGSR